MSDTPTLYQRMLRGEITVQEYVAAVKKSVNKRLGIQGKKWAA